MVRDRSARDDVTTEPLRPAPVRTRAEQRVLIELCRPVLSGRAFTTPSSARVIAEALFIGRGAVQFHLDHLYDKFGIFEREGETRRVILANEAIQRGAVTRTDLETQGPLQE